MPRYYRGHEIFTLRRNLTLLTQKASHAQLVCTNLSSFQWPLHIQQLNDESQELVKCAPTQVCPPSEKKFLFRCKWTTVCYSAQQSALESRDFSKLDLTKYLSSSEQAFENRPSCHALISGSAGLVLPHGPSWAGQPLTSSPFIRSLPSMHIFINGRHNISSVISHGWVMGTLSDSEVPYIPCMVSKQIGVIKVYPPKACCPNLSILS